MTKGKSLRGRHLIIIGRVNVILIIINLIIRRGLWRKRGRMSKTSHASLPTGNVACSGVHLTHLINEIVKTTTKVSLHPLKLLYDGLEGHTTNHGGRRSRRRGWNSRSCKIGCLYLWLLWSKLSLTLPDKTSADGTYDVEKRRQRNQNVKVLKDSRDSRKKDKLITSSGILIHIYNRCDEVRGKVDGKILHQGKKKTSTRFSDGVIVRQWCESECHHHVKEPRAFSKTQAWSVYFTNASANEWLLPILPSSTKISLITQNGCGKYLD